MESRGFGSCFCCLCGRQPDRFVQGRRSSLVTSVLFWSVLQYEGAVKEDGRGKTTWDTFAHTFGMCFGFSISLYLLQQMIQLRFVHVPSCLSRLKNII